MIRPIFSARPFRLRQKLAQSTVCEAPNCPVVLPETESARQMPGASCRSSGSGSGLFVCLDQASQRGVASLGRVDVTRRSGCYEPCFDLFVKRVFDGLAEEEFE